MSCKVVVLIPAYNCGKYIADTIRTILNQSYRNVDIIIINDGSTDNTHDLISGFASTNEKILYINRTENKGVIATRNELLRNVPHDAKYIAWCDSDDLYHYDKIKEQVRFLDLNSKIIGCGTWYKVFGSQKRKVRKFRCSDVVDKQLLFGSPIGFPTFMQRVTPQIRFNVELKSAEDYDYLYQISKIGKLTNISFYGTMYRTHPNQESTSNKNRQLYYHQKISEYIFFERIGSILGKEEIELLLFPNVTKGNIRKYLNIEDRLTSIDKSEHLKIILAYRFLSYNKKKLLFLIRYSFNRFKVMFKLYKLFWYK
ncbi:glycosyltransferase family 2 protein [Vibrio sp. 10N.261.49.A5]|uniref:Glycosyltransferase 2-like domain-containing protein n=1 Tax=Vibrio tasmaniensis 1F-267 TaxID=1191324 RepID=A0ABX3B3W5_9VIBR|nr:glycosyltransferase family 2 protein [Vibrio tasmaniensis]OEF43736.1 hypothetical protein A163_01350 [Vibrio tasmaniensis 1F-267]